MVPMPEPSVDQVIALQASSAQLAEQGRLAEALAATEQAIVLMQALEGSGSPDLANLLADRAELWLETGRLLECQKDATAALTILEPVADQLAAAEGEVLMLRLLGLVGTALREQGRYKEAEPVLQRAVARAESSFGEASSHLAAALNNLGMLYKYSGEHSRAEQQYLRALHITQEGDLMLRATLYHNLGGIAHARGRFAEGEPYARKAWELRAALLGCEHPTTVADAAALGGLLDGLGRFAESEPLYRKALAVFSQRYGLCHFEVAVNYNNLAALLCQTGRHEQGEAMYRQALAIKEKLFAEGHPELAVAYHNLAVQLATSAQPSKRAEGEALLRRSVALFEERLPPTHPSVIACRANLARLTDSSSSAESRRLAPAGGADLPRKG